MIAVLGSGIAAFAAVFECMAARAPCVFVADPFDLALRDRWCIEPRVRHLTRNDGERGLECECAAVKRLQELGVDVEQNWSALDLEFDRWTEATPLTHPERVAAVVHASDGKPSWDGVAVEPMLWGRGASMSASSDAAIYKGQRVAVFASGPHGIDEAIWAAASGCAVDLFLSTERVIAPPCAARDVSQRVARCVTGVEARRVVAAEGGVLVTWARGDEAVVSDSYPVAFLIGEPTAPRPPAHPRVFTAGLAEVNDYGAHHSLAESGIRAARKAIEAVAASPTAEDADS